MHCANCGSTNDDDARFCTQCGKALVESSVGNGAGPVTSVTTTSALCANCGSTNDDDARFCTSCGTSLVDPPALRGMADVKTVSSAAQGIWREKTDEEVIAAVLALSDYTAEGRQIIQDERGRRGVVIGPELVAGAKALSVARGVARRRRSRGAKFLALGISCSIATAAGQRAIAGADPFDWFNLVARLVFLYGLTELTVGVVALSRFAKHTHETPLPGLPRWDVSYLDSESPSSSTNGPSENARAWTWAVATYVGFRAVTVFGGGLGVLAALVNTLQDPLFLVPAVVAIYKTRRRWWRLTSIQR